MKPARHRYPRLEEVRGEEIFTCSQCERGFDALWDLVQHSKKCRECPVLEDGEI